jgi:hypothetical protein
MFRDVFFAILILISGVAVAGAQTRPDFSGTWVIESSRAGGAVMSGGSMAAAAGGIAPAGGGRSSAPLEIRITQTAAALTIERLNGARPATYVYKLDGSESENTSGQTVTRTTSRWVGNTLVTEGSSVTTFDSETMRGTIKEVRSLDAEDRLVLVTSRTAVGMTSEAPGTTQVYRRKQLP